MFEGEERKLNENSLDGGFLQSSDWRFLKEKENFHTEFFSTDTLHASIIEHRIPFIGSYWYIPRGPLLFSLQKKEKVKKDWENILEEAKKKNILWIRIEPKNEEEFLFFSKWSEPFLCEKIFDVQPSEIFCMDISESEEDILLRMKPKTRYNINLAKKKNMRISRNCDELSINNFLALLKETGERNSVSIHNESHYRNFFSSLKREKFELYTAIFQNKPIVSLFVIFFGEYATYLHGASASEDRSLMASYLLQWEAICEAKKRGCIYYDFGGVDTKGFRKSLSGVTRFKRGFSKNTDTIFFPGTFDILLSKRKYRVYFFIKMLFNFVRKVKLFLTK